MASSSAKQDEQYIRIAGGCRDILNGMCNLFNNPEMSDLTLKLGNTEYYAHKFVLGLLSDVFQTMCSRRWGQNGDENVVEVVESEECVPFFEKFLKYLYCGNIEVNVHSALPLLMLADKYNIQPLRNELACFMRLAVKDGSVTGALRWFTYSQVANHEGLWKACLNVIVMRMDEVVALEYFLNLEFEFLVALLGRDDLVVVWEKTLFDAVCRWIGNQPEVVVEEVHMLLSLVRFPMMLPEQLFQIEASAFYGLYKQILSPMLLSTHRFRSIAAEVFDLSTFSEVNCQPRNYSHRFWCHFLTVEMTGDVFYHNSVAACCINHPVLATPEQNWQIQVEGEKKKENSSCRSTFLPNLQYLNTSPCSSKRVASLMLTVVPLRPIKQRVIVDIALYQVKGDKLTRFLCESSVEFTPEEYFSAVHFGSNLTRKCCVSGASAAWQQQSPSNSPNKFFPSPMNFGVTFQESQAKRHEASLQHDFIPDDYDNPAEVPCFKFNGLPRLTNSIRVAVIFKPRFNLSHITADTQGKQCLPRIDSPPPRFLFELANLLGQSNSEDDTD